MVIILVVTIKTFQFRLAAPNHKEGPYNAPTKVLTVNPYDNEAPISSVYSTSSTILNVDTFSLAHKFKQFNGYGARAKWNETYLDKQVVQATITNV